MKNPKIIALLIIISCFMFATGCAKTPVSLHGRLSVQGTNLVDSHGKRVQLRGFSTQHIAKSDMYVSPRYLKELREDFSSDIIRVAMYTTKRDYGYLLTPELKNVVKRVVKDATKEGLYAIIDWHILSDRDPMENIEASKVFFDDMSKEFSSYANVFYEICNEPNGNEVTWNGNIKPYAEVITAVIRKNDPKGIILVGTPLWSSQPQEAAADPLTDPATMYVFHFYPDFATESARQNVARAHEQIPLFCTEFGTSESTGTGKIYPAETALWMDFLDESGISWCNWNLSALQERSAALQVSFKLGTAMRLADRLSPSGELIRYYMRRGRVSEAKLVKPAFINETIYQ